MHLRFIGSSRKTWWFVLALVLVLAAVLRFYRIDAQSFWNDEGNSARLAERSLGLIVEGARGDIHPPGYYIVLHYWRALFGASEAALRGLSAVCSVVTVAVVYALALRLLKKRTVALIAAALVAVNPFQIYYAQETRMYAMLAMWALSSSVALVLWLWPTDKGASKPHWPLVAYVLLATAGLYTHYAFPLVMATQSLFVVAWLAAARNRGNSIRRMAGWGATLGVVLLLYIPWFPTAWRQVTTWSAPTLTFGLSEALADMWRLLSFGHTVPTEAVVAGMVSAAALVALGLLPPFENENGSGGEAPYHWRWVFLVVLVVIPSGLILGLGLYRPAYEKFLLVSAAPLSVLVALGVTSGWRIASGIGVWGNDSGMVGYRAVVLLLVGFFLFDTARSLHNLYFDETYVRADYRAIARRIESQARLGDAVILNAPNQWEVFTIYHADDEHVFPLARQRPFDPGENQTELEQIVADHDRVYGVFWGAAESDPNRFIENWLEAHTYKAGETWYSDVRLATYAVPARVADVPEVLLRVGFARSTASDSSIIGLDGFTLLNEAAAPGDILQVALFWRAIEPVAERYKVFVHLYDDAGRVVAQTDSEPGATLRPTDSWVPGETVIDRYGVLIPADVPNGSYSVAVGLYDLADPTERLGVLAGDSPRNDHVVLGTVAVSSGGR